MSQGELGRAAPMPFLVLSGALWTQGVTVQARQGLWRLAEPKDHHEGWAGFWEIWGHPGVRGFACHLSLRRAEPCPGCIEGSSSLPQVSAGRGDGDKAPLLSQQILGVSFWLCLSGL